MENICDYLYDDLRPRVLHEPRLTALCEVCTVIQALIVLDVPLSLSNGAQVEHDDDDDDAEDLNSTNVGRHGTGTLRISQLLQLILQDAQTRLFFKAQSVIQSDIKYFVPASSDLAYPEKLISSSLLVEIYAF